MLVKELRKVAKFDFAVAMATERENITFDYVDLTNRSLFVAVDNTTVESIDITKNGAVIVYINEMPKTVEELRTACGTYSNRTREAILEDIDRELDYYYEKNEIERPSLSTKEEYVFSKFYDCILESYKEEAEEEDDDDLI